MPYKIEVVNETIQGVWQDVRNLAIVMGQGGNNAFRAPATPQPEQPVAPPVEQIPDEALEVIAPAEKRKPGRPPKAPQTVISPAGHAVEVTSEAFDARREAALKPEVVDFDLGPATKTLTLKDDIQPRVRAIVDNYKEREAVKAGRPAEWTGNAPEEKIIMQGAVNYAVALLAKFDVKKATDLTPDQFADFMAQSEAYVTGVAI